jgi:VWFA-related protein
MSRAWKLLAPATAFLCAASPAALAAQTSQSNQKPAPTVRVSTSLVLVDVVAADKHGKFVSGLTATDFRVLENGKEQSIAVFHEEQTPGAPPPPTPLPRNTYTNLPAYHPPSGPLMVVLLDALNTPLFSQSRAHMALIRYVAKLLKQDRPMAILSLTDRLTVLQDFTTSRSLLLAAAKRFSPGESGAVSARSAMTSIGKDKEYQSVLELSNESGNPQTLLWFYQHLLENDRQMVSFNDQQRAEITAQALQAIAAALQGYAGRKNLIWVSAGFPSLYYSVSGSKLASTVVRELHRAADLLNEARVAVYPVDARGLTNKVTLGDYHFNVGDWEGKVTSPMYDLFASQQTMRSVAQATGGVAFYNSNDITHAIAAAVADSRDSYLLGYYPADRNWNGKFRRITVKAARKGLELRYRRGYYALPGFAASETKPEKSPEQKLQAALLDPLPSTGVLFRVETPPPNSQGLLKGRILLPGSAVTLGSSCDLNLSLRIAALTPAGTIARELNDDVQRRLPPQQCLAARNGALGFPFLLSLKPGSYQLECLARDNYTGAVGRVDVPIRIKPQ